MKKMLAVLLVIAMTGVAICALLIKTDKSVDQPELDSIYTSDMFKFSVKYPSVWYVAKQDEFGDPNVGISILFENNENQKLRIFGVVSSTPFGEYEGVEKTEYITSKGMVADCYSRTWQDGIVKTYMLGEWKELAVLVTMTESMYNKYEKTILNIVNSIEFL